MKIIFSKITIFLLSSTLGYSQVDTVKSEDLDLLVKGDDWNTAIYVYKGGTDVFSGIAVDYHYETKLIETAFQIKEGKTDSCWIRRYFKNCQIREEEWYKNGSNHGKYLSWYKSGQLEESGEYMEDLKEGIWTGYHENGDRFYVNNYVNGKLEGDWKIWEYGNELTFHEVYKNGIKIKKIM